MRARSWFCLGLAVLIALFCAGFPFQKIWDDGMKEMDFHFHVVDAETRQPIECALIAIRDDVYDPEMTYLVTDGQGIEPFRQ